MTISDIQKELELNIHQQIIFINSDRFPQLKGQYFYVTATLFEDDTLIFGILNNKMGWITLKLSPDEWPDFINKEIELCEGEPFDSERIKMTEDINNSIKKVKERHENIIPGS